MKSFYKLVNTLLLLIFYYVLIDDDTKCRLLVTTVSAADSPTPSTTSASVCARFTTRPPRIRHAHFTNDSYTGYISENLNQQLESPPDPQNNVGGVDLDKWRRNVVVRASSSSHSNRPLIYVRFVDRLKPSLRLTTTWACGCLSDDHLSVSFMSNDYEQEAALELFQLDRESIVCLETEATTTTIDEDERECLCYFQTRLNDDPMVRDRLNREAKDSYKFQISTLNVTASINIQV